MPSPAELSGAPAPLVQALGLTGDWLVQALTLFSAHPVGKGAPALRQGDVWQHALFVERGILRMYFIDRDGKEFNKNFHAEGALVFPLTEAMAGAPSLFAIAAVEPARVWKAPAAAFRAAMQSAGQWDALRTRSLEGLITHKLQREHDLLALDGATRYRQLCKREPQLAERLPLSQLASYLGLTDVSLSRIRRKLKHAEG